MCSVWHNAKNLRLTLNPFLLKVQWLQSCQVQVLCDDNATASLLQSLHQLLRRCHVRRVIGHVGWLERAGGGWPVGVSLQGMHTRLDVNIMPQQHVPPSALVAANAVVDAWQACSSCVVHLVWDTEHVTTVAIRSFRRVWYHVTLVMPHHRYNRKRPLQTPNGPKAFSVKLASCT